MTLDGNTNITVPGRLGPRKRTNVTLAVRTFGSLTLHFDGNEIALPSSRKTRALLAYLVLAEGKHSRQSLCDFFWDTPDDPRAALRWSLSKLRPVVNAGGKQRLVSDRQAVWVEAGELILDRNCLTETVADTECSEPEADKVWRLAEGVLLEDCELPNQRNFMIWLEGHRTEASHLRAQLSKRFAMSLELPVRIREKWSERWLGDASYSSEAAVCLVNVKQLTAGKTVADDLVASLTKRFRDAEIEAPAFQTNDTATDKFSLPSAPVQEIQFVEAHDGVSIAWARIGEENNPPLVKAANWLNHLELDWEAPIWSPLFRDLSQSFRVVRYDERGCGLSDWEVSKIDLEQFVEDLERVVDAAQLDRFPLLGISQGAAVSIEFAARHPERVSNLILFGAYDCGWRHNATPDEVLEREAVMVLTKSGWGSDNPAYRHVFSRTFMPDASPEELDWFDEFQRHTTSPENAVRFLEAFSQIDVRDRLADVQCPTLVVHSRGDLRIPFATGRSIASRIPGAKLAGIDSNNHLLLGREKASGEFVNLVRNFLKVT